MRPGRLFGVVAAAGVLAVVTAAPAHATTSVTSVGGETYTISMVPASGPGGSFPPGDVPCFAYTLDNEIGAFSSTSGVSIGGSAALHNFTARVSSPGVSMWGEGDGSYSACPVPSGETGGSVGIPRNIDLTDSSGSISCSGTGDYTRDSPGNVTITGTVDCGGGHSGTVTITYTLAVLDPLAGECAPPLSGFPPPPIACVAVATLTA